MVITCIDERHQPLLTRVVCIRFNHSVIIKNAVPTAVVRALIIPKLKLLFFFHFSSLIHRRNRHQVLLLQTREFFGEIKLYFGVSTFSLEKKTSVENRLHYCFLKVRRVLHGPSCKEVSWKRDR